MSETNSYKVVSFSPAQSFAVVRGLRARVAELEHNLTSTKPGKDADYLREQLATATSTLTMFSSARFFARREAA